jgi:DNA (cytosine-5)-methyltransferase 1
MERLIRPTVVDIFCGCGGLSEGFRQAGFDILLGIDHDPYAIQTYNKHHDSRGRIASIEDINADYIFSQTGARNIDVLVGGPPCQAFSTVAIAKWRSLGIPGTIQHPLNKLYADFLRIVLDVSPSFFVMENVQRMMSVKQGSVKQAIQLYLGGKYNLSFYHIPSVVRNMIVRD